MDNLDPRRQELWRLQDFASGRGLEVGPLHDAIVSRTWADVRYVDITDREGLRAYYRDHPGIPIDNIPDIDYPLTQPDGRIATLAEAARPGAPFNWAVASHVVEHVPDLIGWLAELADVVVDDGALVLVVPDRRYCFDVHRPPTTVGAMLEANLLGAQRPGVRAVYDHYSQVVAYDVAQLWLGNLPVFADRHHTLDEARAMATKSVDGAYVDCHVWLFSPDEFVSQMNELRSIGLSSWYVDCIRPTSEGTLEFMVRLRRMRRGVGVGDSAIPGELVPEKDKPAWAVEIELGRQARRLSVEVSDLKAEVAGGAEHVLQLEAVVAGLADRLQRRSGRTGRLRRRLANQQTIVRSQAAQLTALQTQISNLQRPLWTRALHQLRSRLRQS